jgi:hypothetical protein
MLYSLVLQAMEMPRFDLGEQIPAGRLSPLVPDRATLGVVSDNDSLPLAVSPRDTYWDDIKHDQHASLIALQAAHAKQVRKDAVSASRLASDLQVACFNSVIEGDTPLQEMEALELRARAAVSTAQELQARDAAVSQQPAVIVDSPDAGITTTKQRLRELTRKVVEGDTADPLQRELGHLVLQLLPILPNIAGTAANEPISVRQGYIDAALAACPVPPKPLLQLVSSAPPAEPAEMPASVQQPDQPALLPIPFPRVKPMTLAPPLSTKGYSARFPKR